MWHATDTSCSITSELFVPEEEVLLDELAGLPSPLSLCSCLVFGLDLAMFAGLEVVTVVVGAAVKFLFAERALTVGCAEYNLGDLRFDDAVAVALDSFLGVDETYLRNV